MVHCHDRVIYAGSCGKALYPGIRVGYLVVPPRLVGTFRNLSGPIHRSVPMETQLALAGLARIDCSDSGLNALAWLDGDRDDRTAHRAVLETGLQCYPLSDYTISTSPPGGCYDTVERWDPMIEANHSISPMTGT